MKYLRITPLLATLAVAALPASALAEVIVRTPVGTFVFGRPAARCAPLINVQTGPVGVIVNPGARPAPAPPLAPSFAPSQVPVPREVPPSGELSPAPAPAVLTVNDFATAFRPCAGVHEVCLVHPCTGKMVTIAFTLPDGACRHVHVSRHELEFDYGRHSVRIHFRRNGTVKVAER